MRMTVWWMGALASCVAWAGEGGVLEPPIAVGSGAPAMIEALPESSVERPDQPDGAAAQGPARAQGAAEAGPLVRRLGLAESLQYMQLQVAIEQARLDLARLKDERSRLETAPEPALPVSMAPPEGGGGFGLGLPGMRGGGRVLEIFGERAIIEMSGRRHTVRQGARVNGWQVARVGPDTVILCRGQGETARERILDLYGSPPIPDMDMSGSPMGMDGVLPGMGR